jgi:hypothetical protein
MVVPGCTYILKNTSSAQLESEYYLSELTRARQITGPQFWIRIYTLLGLFFLGIDRGLYGRTAVAVLITVETIDQQYTHTVKSN